MANEKFDYVALLSELEAKKAALEASIATIKSAMALGVLGPASEGVDLSSVGSSNPGADNSIPNELPHHAFLGMSLPAAIKLYLEVVKKKKTIKEIAAALREHGMESTSDNFESVVTGALNRLKGAKEILRFKDGWGLSSWYPASFRSQISSAVKPSRGKKKKGKKKKSQETDGAKAESAEAIAAPSLTKRIADILNKKNGAALAPSQIAEELGVPIRGLNLILGGMVSRKTIVKTESGLYSAPLSNVREMSAVV